MRNFDEKCASDVDNSPAGPSLTETYATEIFGNLLRMHPGRKLQKDYKRRFHLITFHSYEHYRAYEIREFSQMSHNHFSVGRKNNEYWVKFVLIYLYTWYTSWSKQYDTKRKNLVNFHLGSCQVSLAVKKRILPEEDFTLDNTTGMRWETEFTVSYTLKWTS